MCLAQGHNAVTPVKLGPMAARSRVKHSTTEPLRSLSENKEDILKINLYSESNVCQIWLDFSMYFNPLYTRIP